MTTKSMIKSFTPLTAVFAIGTLLVNPNAKAAVNLGASQWVWQNPLPQGNTLNAITCISLGSELVCTAVGDRGTILYGSSTTGASPVWSSQNSGTTENLQAVACPDGNTCYAVGDNGTILATTNSGVTWKIQPVGAAAVPLTGVSCQSASHCFAVGSLMMLATTDGLTWGGQTHQGGSTLTAVSCPDANTCYATANNSGGNPAILKTTSGGAWQPTGAIIDNAVLTSINCGSSSSCVALDNNGNSISTTDGGKTWSLASVAGPIIRPSLYSVSCWNTLDCVAVGAAGPSPYNLYWTSNAGATWYGESSGASALGKATLNGVSCPNGTCAAVGFDGAMTTNYPSKSVYNGIETAVPTRQLRKVSCANTNDCYAVGDDGIIATTNGGATWTKQDSTGLLGIHCPSATNCFAVGGGSILATVNSGQTWKSPTPVGTQALLYEVNCPNTTTCFAAGTSILSTADAGKTWITEKAFPPSYPGAFAITCTNTTSCIAVGYGGWIFVRSVTASGAQWNGVNYPGNKGDSFQDVSCPEPAYCIAVGDTGTTVISTDGGQHWTLQPYSTIRYLSSVGCLSGSQLCYATTWDGFIFSSLGNSGWTQEAQQEWLLDGVSCAYSGADYRCVAVGGAPGVIVSKLHTPTTGGGGGGGGHCGTPTNPCQQ